MCYQHPVRIEWNVKAVRQQTESPHGLRVGGVVEVQPYLLGLDAFVHRSLDPKSLEYLLNHLPLTGPYMETLRASGWSNLQVLTQTRLVRGSFGAQKGIVAELP